MVLVTGGAGFIGSHVVERLLQDGDEVRVFDSLIDQVHQGAGPRYVPDDAEFVEGDVRDRDCLAEALDGVGTVVHLAAEVGVGQSMYDISRYVGTNTSGTAVLLDIIANDHTDVRRIVVASSMSLYGEGEYSCPEHGLVAPRLRSEDQLKARQWELRCSWCAEVLSPVPTREEKALFPGSVYAITKMDQELLCLAIGAAYDIDVVALRYFNAYGPRQALSNPYTGVAAIFSSRLINKRPPLMFEDGQQLRDFVHVRDVARATVLAIRSSTAAGHAINVGVGTPLTISQVAELLAGEMGLEIEPEPTGTYRAGDIRHRWADPAKAEQLLGFRAEIELGNGLAELIEWVSRQEPTDEVEKALAELDQRGLSV
jgi:dTDP-L-rhamnose 4-epimerase